MSKRDVYIAQTHLIYKYCAIKLANLDIQDSRRPAMALILLLIVLGGTLLAWILRGTVVYWIEVLISIAAGRFINPLHQYGLRSEHSCTPEALRLSRRLSVDKWFFSISTLRKLRG